MAEGFLFEKLIVLNTVYDNTLVTGKSPPKASVVKTQLFPHQATLVNGMHIFKDKITFFSSYKNNCGS